MGNQLQQLTRAGQSIWLDNIERSMFASGELRRLVASGLRGMTSNPSIFEEAIDGGHAYDAQIESLIGRMSDPNAIFEAIHSPLKAGRRSPAPTKQCSMRSRPTAVGRVHPQRSLMKNA